MFKKSEKKLNARFGIVLILLFIFVFSACKKEESVNFDEYNEQKAKQKSEKEEGKKAESLKNESKDEAGDITEIVSDGKSQDAGNNDSDKKMESENLEDSGSASGKDIMSPQENSDPDDNSENVDVSITEDETVVTGEAEKIETIQLTTGQLVRFGSYEQDNDTSNGKEPIEWIVLSVDEEQGRALLLSRYVLDRIPLYDKDMTI